MKVLLKLRTTLSSYLQHIYKVIIILIRSTPSMKSDSISHAQMKSTQSSEVRNSLTHADITTQSESVTNADMTTQSESVTHADIIMQSQSDTNADNSTFV